MNGSNIAEVIAVAVIIAVWWWNSDRDVAAVTSTPGVSFRLGFAAVFGTYQLALLPSDILDGDWPVAVMHAVVGALCARVVWSWWRRRRKGKPSRVLGLVRDLGHKLGVVAVPVTEGGR